MSGITLSTSKRGERGMRCEIDRCANETHVRVENIMYRYYGFPGGAPATYTIEQARIHAQSILDEGGRVEEWDDDLGAMIGLHRPVEAAQ